MSLPPRTLPSVEFAFGAAFQSLLSIPLRAGFGESSHVSDLLPTASGRFWIADALSSALRIYSSDGEPLRSLDRKHTGLRRPVSLTSLYGHWIVALDGYVPTVAILDERGDVLRRFAVQELDRPVQICNVCDRWLAVVGSGWERGAGRLVHLYTPSGEYVESLFGEPLEGEAAGRAYVAAGGSAVYLGHSDTDSFAIYDVEARAVLAFPRLSGCPLRTVAREVGDSLRLSGLFAAACGPLIAVYTSRAPGDGYRYDLYGLDGAPVVLRVSSPERIVAVEGPLFYSVREDEGGGLTLSVWKVRFDPGGSRVQA